MANAASITSELVIQAASADGELRARGKDLRAQHRTAAHGNDDPYTSVLQSDGKILAAGRAAGVDGYDVAVARYWP